MDANEQEAKSRRYGRDTFSVLLLKSGKIAVLSPFVMRDLVAVVDTFEEAVAAWNSVKHPSKEEYIAQMSPEISTLNLDGIDL